MPEQLRYTKSPAESCHTGDKMNRKVNAPNCEIDEDEAIERAKNGDIRGYEVLYSRHRRAIYSLCLRRTRNVCDAEDLTQEVFMQLYRKIGSFRAEAKFRTWLYQIALNFMLMHARRERWKRVDLTSSLEDSLSLRLKSCTPAEYMALRQAISDLPRGRKNVVLLHDFAGYTHQEVARRLGVTVSTSRARLYRAHVSLRNVLGQRVLPSPELQQSESSCDFLMQDRQSL